MCTPNSKSNLLKMRRAGMRLVALVRKSSTVTEQQRGKFETTNTCIWRNHWSTKGSGDGGESTRSGILHTTQTGCTSYKIANSLWHICEGFRWCPFLNDPPLQNKLWRVLVRGHLNPVVATGNLQKAFLQVRIREADRDAMCLHGCRDKHFPLTTLWFTRPFFGLTSSPFLLGELWRHTLATGRRKSQR